MARHTKPRFWLLLGLPLSQLVAGCITSTFVVTDPRANARPPTRPTMFIDRLPEIPFYSIGIIEVRAPAGTELGKVLDEAVRKGGEVGCDMVIDRVIYRISYGIPKARALLAQSTFYPPPTVTQPAPVYIPEAPPDRREFVCGVATNSANRAPLQPPKPPPPPPPSPSTDLPA